MFAPVAARLASGNVIESTHWAYSQLVGSDWQEEKSQVVFIDAFGNAMTGLNAEKVKRNSRLVVNDQVLQYAETFCKVPPGQAFWFENSQGLVEIAANGASAAALLSLALGSTFLIN